MFNVGDKVVWAEGARKGRVVDTHADGRLLEIETDNGDLFYKGYEDVDRVELSYDELKAERDKLAAQVHDLQREIDELNLADLHKIAPAPGSGLVAVIVDKDGDTWQHDGTDEYGQDVYTMSGNRSSDVEYGRQSFKSIEELYGVRETRGKR